MSGRGLDAQGEFDPAQSLRNGLGESSDGNISQHSGEASAPQVNGLTEQ